MLELKKVTLGKEEKRAHICTPCFAPCIPDLVACTPDLTHCIPDLIACTPDV